MDLSLASARSPWDRAFTAFSLALADPPGLGAQAFAADLSTARSNIASAYAVFPGTLYFVQARCFYVCYRFARIALDIGLHAAWGVTCGFKQHAGDRGVAAGDARKYQWLPELGV